MTNPFVVAGKILLDHPQVEVDVMWSATQIYVFLEGPSAKQLSELNSKEQQRLKIGSGNILQTSVDFLDFLPTASPLKCR